MNVENLKFFESEDRVQVKLEGRDESEVNTGCDRPTERGVDPGDRRDLQVFSMKLGQKRHLDFTKSFFHESYLINNF